MGVWGGGLITKNIEGRVRTQVQQMGSRIREKCGNSRECYWRGYSLMIAGVGLQQNMLEEGFSSSNSDQELNYKQFIELDKETKTKRSKNTRSSKEVEALKQQAMKLFINGDLAESKEKAMQIITLDPKNYEVYFLMGQIQELDGDKKRAAHYFTLSAELSPPDPGKWQKIGDLYSDIQFYQQAAYCYGRCLKSDPHNADVILKRAQSYERGQEFRKAIGAYYKLLRIAPNLSIIKDCARLHCRVSQFDKAREILRQAPGEDLNIVYMICETYMKEEKYEELAKEISKSVLLEGRADLNTVMPEFLKMLVLAGLHLSLPQVEKYLGALIGQLDNDVIDVFEGLVGQLESMNRPEIAIRLLENMISSKLIDKKPEYYLKLAEHYKKNNWGTRATQVLQRGSALFPDNKNIRSELGFLKIKTGHSKEGVALVRQQSQEEVYISDLSEDEKPIKASQLMKTTNISKPTPKTQKKKTKKQKPVETPPQQDELQMSIEKTISNLYETIQLKKDQPQILLELYSNIQSLLRDVFSYYTKLKLQTYMDNEPEEKRGLFSKRTKKRKRRTRAEQKGSIKEQQLAHILHTWLTHVFQLSCWFKIFSLSSIISKLIFLKRFPEQRKRIYQLCILACLQLKKYRRAFFLLRYLLTQDPNNIFYVLLCNVLVRKINTPNICKFILAKLVQYQGKYPNLSYLIAFEHLQSGYFEHSIKTLLKIAPTRYNEQNIMLAFVSCFIQLASSRNTTDKLTMVNRATYLLNEYRKVVQKKDDRAFQLFHNLGRFYHQLRLTSKAIQYYSKAIDVGRSVDHPSTHRTVYSLMCLYKDIDDHAKYTSLSKQYFCI